MVNMHTVNRFLDTFSPTHYDLTLTLEREARQFNGHVTIEGIAPKDTKTIGLHAKGLDISSIKSKGKTIEFKLDGDELILSLPLKADETVKLTIEFNGRITDGMHGLYPCYYEHDGTKKELLATQFESHHAREVFPCIDEPAAKATFDVTLETETGVTVLGNMPVASQEEVDDRLVTSFDTSPRMSPYLLAFVVGELQRKTTKTANGTEVNVWATHAQLASSLDFGLDIAVKCIEFFNEYFDTPYPLPKCDHVALPDFSSGAMENWGLITYREMTLLADSSSGISTKQYVATVIAHETSHQWFGNLVTMQWWDDLWLNESFATLMEYVAIDAIKPEWNIWMSYASHESLSALRRDHLPGVQAVKTGVNHPDEISTLFDPSIVYAKGARLLTMLRAYVGDEAFRSGLKDYFQKHAYKNTVGDDLWKALSTHTEIGVAAFMRPWLEQPGMPIVTVESLDNAFQLSQSRFLIPDNGDGVNALWPIPIRLGQDTYHLMDEPKLHIAAPLPLNSGGAVHAVTSYDKLSLEAITNKLIDGDIEPVDRLSLLNELSLVTRAGRQPTTDLITLLEAYLDETNEPVWSIIGLIYGDLKRFVETDESAEAALKARIMTHARQLYERLGSRPKDSDSQEDSKLRATILGLLSYAEYQPLIDDLLATFRAGSDNISDLDGELRGLILSAAVKHGTASEIDGLINLYDSSSSADLRHDICSALCVTKDPKLVERLLARLTDSSKTRPQDVDYWFVFLMRNRHARELTWQWMTGNWKWIEETFKSDKSYDALPRYAASALSTNDWLARYRDFFEPLREQAALKRVIDLGIEEIQGRAAWLERDGEAVRDLLKL